MYLKNKLLLSLSLLSFSQILFSGELSGGLGGSSNYIYRGETQTSNGSSLHGILNYNHNGNINVGAGFYTGLAGGDREIDLYTDYSWDMGPLNYKVGVFYTNFKHFSSTELSAYLSKDAFSIGINQDIASGGATVYDLGYASSIAKFNVAANYYISSASNTKNKIQASISRNISGLNIGIVIGDDGAKTVTSVAIGKALSF